MSDEEERPGPFAVIAGHLQSLFSRVTALEQKRPQASAAYDKWKKTIGDAWDGHKAAYGAAKADRDKLDPSDPVQMLSHVVLTGALETQNIVRRVVALEQLIIDMHRAAKEPEQEPESDAVLDLTISGEINAESAAPVLEALASNQEAEEVRLFINSEGGHVNAALNIYDAIMQHPARVKTGIVVGKAHSAALMPLLACTSLRAALPGATFLIHGTHPIDHDVPVDEDERSNLRLQDDHERMLAEELGIDGRDWEAWRAHAQPFDVDAALALGLLTASADEEGIAKMLEIPTAYAATTASGEVYFAMNRQRVAAVSNAMGSGTFFGMPSSYMHAAAAFARQRRQC